MGINKQADCHLEGQSQWRWFCLHRLRLQAFVLGEETGGLGGKGGKGPEEGANTAIAAWAD